MRMLKRLLRWFIKTALMLVVLFAIVIISQYLSHRYKPGSVLVLKLDGAVVERSSTNALGIMSSDQTALDVIRRSLKGAGTDNRIVGLAIKVFDPQMQLAQAQELCAMIAEFRSHGKWTTAYMETAGEGGFGNLPFMVASAADEVSMMPQGEINILASACVKCSPAGCSTGSRSIPISPLSASTRTPPTSSPRKTLPPPSVRKTRP